MKRLLLTTALLAAVGATPAMASLLTREVFDGATLVDTVTSTTGVLNLSTSDANFSEISATVVGVPLVGNPDLSSVTLNVKSANGRGRTS